MSVSARRLPILALGVVALLGLSCSEEVDKAARARIFSPEDPPQSVSSAKEPLPVDQLAQKPELALRVINMEGAEAIERLGAHALNATLTTEWSYQGKSKKLIEQRSLVASKGAVFGDFHATSNVDNDEGLEVMRVKNKVYARNRFGKFRQRLRDRGMAERMRDEVYATLGDVNSLFRNRIALSPMGSVTHQGRQAWRFKISLAEEPPEVEAPNLPPVPAPRTKGGVDSGTKARARFFENRNPVAVDGQLLVDAESSVVLKVKLSGKLTAPAPEGKPGKADVRITLDSDVTAIGKDPRLNPPADFLPDADKPQGLADALDRFGMPRAGRDGGTTDAAVENETDGEE